MPKLENLTLSSFDIGKDSLHIEHVKHVVLYETAPFSIEKLSFSNLQSLKMYYASSLMDEWMQFFKQHSNFKRLDLTENGHRNSRVCRN